MGAAGVGGSGGTVPVEWNGRQVQAWLPTQLGQRDLSLTEAEVRATEQAAAALRDADTRIPHTWEALARLLLRHEGIASSGIEGLREPLVSVLVAERTDGDGAAGWVADNLAVIRMAHDTAHDPLDVETLHEWHARLMRNSDLDPSLIGVFRDGVGWVGGNSPLDAAYVPPPPDRIPALMDDLVKFADNDDGPDPITRAAVVHAQFEAIHPYGDGNGRIGRILISRALRRSGLTTRSTMPISVAVARDPGGYLSGLAMYQQMGAIGPWVRWFSQIARKAADTTKHLAEQTRQITDGWLTRLDDLRADSSARALAPLLVGHPVVSAQDVMALLGISHYAARRSLLTLQDRGLIEQVEARSPGAGRNRQWYAATELIRTWAS